jgi:hypothetical protein
MMGPGDTLTIVRDAQRRPLTKSYRLRGGRIVKNTYPNVAEVFAEVVPVDGIEGLAAVLDNVTSGGTAAVIRGAPWPVVSPQRLARVAPADAAGGAGVGADWRADLA